MAASDDLHRLLDALPERELHTAKRFLEFLRDASSGQQDPVLHAFLAAPIDDEPLSEEEAAAIQAARDEVLRGEVVTFEEALGGANRTA